MRPDPEVEELEVRLILEAIHSRYGYDLREYARPSMRRRMLSALSRSEAATFVDASAYAARYNAEAEQLNAQEKRRRTEGDTLDDFSIARMSSFLKSYGEMQKGEQFVMQEVRARARERIRWIGALGLMMLALLTAPFPWRSAGGWLSR